MAGCFRDIHTFSAGYERAKGYKRVDFDAPEVNQQSMKSSPQMMQDSALDAVDPTSKTDSQNTGST